MPITYAVQPHEPIVIATLAGNLQLRDYRDTLHRALADPRYQPGSAILLDVRAVDRLPSIDDLRGLVGLARELSARAVEPFAIVVATDLQFVAGRLFATLASATINLETRVFRTMDAAMSWLQTAISLRASVARPKSDARAAALTS
jgi:SpoIIAA-like